MLFCTPEYLLFLALIVLGLLSLQKSATAQRLWLLLGSNFFYGFWDYRFLLLLWASILVDFTLARWIEDKPAFARRYVRLSVLVNLCILGFFKYFNFFSQSTAEALQYFGIAYDPLLISVLLPLGISFYTFQSMGYTIDVYRGQQKASRDFLSFSLFICFFPQLVAGPIERARELLPQLQQPFTVEVKNLVDGLALILWGFIKKALIADTLALALVDPYYQEANNAGYVALAALAFTLQVFCDFSGYVDIGRGSAKLFGVELRENFIAPFFSPNIAQFWNRWHRTLSDWFRDYVFIPLGGSRGTWWQTQRNIAITMLLCGFWHGADLKFLVWGGYYAIIQLIHRTVFFAKKEEKEIWPQGASWLLQPLKILCTFTVVVIGSFIFRTVNYYNAHRMLTVFFTTPFYIEPNRRWKIVAMLATAFAVIIVDHLVKLRRERIAWEQWSLPQLIFAGAVAGLLWVIVFLFGSVFNARTFVYFQF